jgi:hypothetical protein
VLASWHCARERDLRLAGPVSAQFGPPPFFLTVLKTVLILGLQVANKNLEKIVKIPVALQSI